MGAIVNQGDLQPDQLALLLCNQLTQDQAIDPRSAAAAAAAAEVRGSTLWQRQSFTCTGEVTAPLMSHHAVHPPGLPCAAALNASIAVEKVVAAVGATMPQTCFCMRSEFIIDQHWMLFPL